MSPGAMWSQKSGCDMAVTVMLSGGHKMLSLLMDLYMVLPHFLTSDALPHDTARRPIPERKAPLPSLKDPER